MKYIVIRNHHSLEDFQETINRFLENGWKLQGGVSISVYEYPRTAYAQALVKE